MTPTPPSVKDYFKDYLPIELIDSIQFILEDQLNQNLLSVSSNFFFQPNKTDTGYHVTVRENGNWDLLPKEWRDYFEGIDSNGRDELLNDLANLKIRDNMPMSLVKYLSSCRDLSLERTCSNIPLLSYPPSLPPRTTPLPLAPPTWHKIPLTPRGRKGRVEIEGLSPKKGHECHRFGELLSLREGMTLDDEGGIIPLHPTHVIDVGAGCGHLSRFLAAPPHNLQVLALDWSIEQTLRAAKLNAKDINLSKPVKITAVEEVRGSLTHSISALDARGLVEVMKNWPIVEEGKEESEAMLIALHACGTLIVDALKAFIGLEKERPETKRQAILVGCCYNLLDPTDFPLSQHITSLLSASSAPPLSMIHLKISPQAPSTWYLTPPNLTLAFRAYLDAEILVLRELGYLFPEEIKVGRIGFSSTFKEYRTKAYKKLGYPDSGAESLPRIIFGSGKNEVERNLEWEEAVYKLKVWWTLRANLGPVVESLLILDRFAIMIEGMKESWKDASRGRKVELFNLFDQETGSLRNTAIVVK